MNRLVPGLVLALLAVVGCSSDQLPSIASVDAVTGGNAAIASAAIGPVHKAGRQSFAHAADRGDMLAYPNAPLVRREGAYTWHRVDMSETHALRAVGGALLVTSPSGEQLKFNYQRHVEHPNGDWTWVGKLDSAPGEEALITFGERAAFGSIGQAGKPPLRLTIRDGASWLVETDPVAIAVLNSPATKPQRPDYLLPPDKARTIAESAPQPSGLVVGQSTPSSDGPVVDVVLGYTNGFAAGLGGESQALTRLNNLIDITNQAYINSQVNARVRLVRAVQVFYPDATDNRIALEELTGYKSGTGSVPVPAALQPLRQARDAYGGDLVSLVRKFNDPENDGCGIAWLLGGGRSGIDSSDAPFGYSVVSDGVDAGNDGKNYFCRDETLAHELGHNMGSQHDRAAATKDGVLKYGVFDFSFGYNTTGGSGNFYTVMAYGESGQTRYRVFSNPRTAYCGGFACGIENNSDNARSLSQTIPIIATFRATVVAMPPPQAAPRMPNDANGDGRSDLIWTRPSTLAYSVMNGAAITQSNFFYVSSAYYVAATGDYDGNGHVDILWTSAANDLYLWMGHPSGNFLAPQFLGNYSSAWAIWPVSGDMNADGKDDIVWHQPGAIAYSLMDGPQITQSRFFTSPGGHRIASVGDFDGDGRLDILWTSSNSELTMWLADGSGSFLAPRSMGGYSSVWSIAPRSGDIDGDGKSDIIWYRPTEVAYTIMNGSTYVRSQFFPVPGDYTIVAIGDYDGNRRLDFVFTTTANDLFVWLGDGNGFAQAPSSGRSSPGWSLRW